MATLMTSLLITKMTSHGHGLVLASHPSLSLFCGCGCTKSLHLSGNSLMAIGCSRSPSHVVKYNPGPNFDEAERSCSRSRCFTASCKDSDGAFVNMDAANQCSLTRRKLIIGTFVALFPLLGSNPQNQLLGTSLAEATEGELELEKIQEELRKVISKSKAAGILRLVFHDAGTFDLKSNSGGMNGSILLELERPENTGLKRSVKVLEKAKTNLDPVLHVSWADLIAIAGAEAVAICGGPRISVKLGRLDSSLSDPEGQLPEENLNAASLKENFQKKGFSTQELVVLSGAHTLGSKGFGEATVFDNSYFRTLLSKPWLDSGENMAAMVGLPSDRALIEDSECKKWLEVYAGNQDAFFKDFAVAYLKLVDAGARWKTINL